MINDKKKIMKAKLKINEFQILEKQNKYSDNLNIVFCDLIRKASNNLWWQCISRFYEFLCLILFPLNDNVSIIIN